MDDLSAVADDVASIVVDLRSDEPVPKGIPNWRVPVTFQASENWHLWVHEKRASMCFTLSELKTGYSREVMARPRRFLDTIEVEAMTKVGAGKAAAAVVLEAVDRGLVPNWRVALGEPFRA